MKKIIILSLVVITVAFTNKSKPPTTFVQDMEDFISFASGKQSLLISATTHQDSAAIFSDVESEITTIKNKWNFANESANIRFPLGYPPVLQCATMCAINYVNCMDSYYNPSEYGRVFCWGNYNTCINGCQHH